MTGQGDPDRPPSRQAIAVAVAIVIGGLALRVWAVGQARFTGDESYFWATARNIATFRAAPVFGPPLTSSSAYHPGPIFYYLMALPQALGASPRWGGLFVVLLHALSGALFFSMSRKASGTRAALVGLLLFAFAPWEVLYSDRIWLSCVAPVWGTLTLYAAVKARDSTRWQGVLVFFALVLPQLHMSAPIVWILCGVLLATDRPGRFGKKAIAGGALVGIVAYLPPLYWELTHGFENTIAIVTQGGGSIGGGELLSIPFRVFGYAMLYATAEIGYHFSRGYWTTFSEADQYGTALGLRAWLDLHGPLFAFAILVSAGVSLTGWVSACVRSGHLLLARRRGEKVEINLFDRLVFGLVAALSGGALLMMASRKAYFPHYTNLLMPILLLPSSVVLGSLIERRGKGRVLGYVLTIVTAFGMAASSVRYYRRVDALNGLDATVSMVERAVGEGGPIALEFEGFQNGFAWQMLASVKHERALEVKPHAAIRYRVKNREPHRGDIPKNSTRHGIVVLQRFEGSAE